MRRFMQRIQAARTALLTVASFTAGTAAVWTAWGMAPGFGAMAGFLLWLAHLSVDDKGKGST
jgi:hypothetical protein